MIENQIEYTGALKDLEDMERSLAELLRQPLRQPDFDRLGVRRMIARLHEELARFEAHLDRPDWPQRPTPEIEAQHILASTT